jgi:hypothetical protein
MRKKRDTRKGHEGFQFFLAKKMQDNREATPTITLLLVVAKT